MLLIDKFNRISFEHPCCHGKKGRSFSDDNVESVDLYLFSLLSGNDVMKLDFRESFESAWLCNWHFLNHFGGREKKKKSLSHFPFGINGSCTPIYWSWIAILHKLIKIMCKKNPLVLLCTNVVTVFYIVNGFNCSFVDGKCNFFFFKMNEKIKFV